ncbi:MAG: SAM-dependent methyltransferase [Gammaproteobacteria bacterium]|nr:SAM-dependent methyltransferase [Gammaproteobacteria bacterium]
MHEHLDRLPEPEPDARAHGDRVAARLGEAIAEAGGALPFDRFMELALYAPGLGYYSAGARRFGRGGDFVTAPEVSSLFGRCLAAQAAEVLERLGGGDLLELGAGRGTLAADLLEALEARDRLPGRYLILDVSGALREEQRETLARRVPGLLDRVAWLDALPAGGFRGLVLGNEVADALPVSRFRLAGGRVLEAHVRQGADGGFAWSWPEAGGALASRVRALLDEVGPLPDGYTSELCPRLEPWIASLAGALDAGALLLVDYGYPRREYYLPERVDGTLQCHYRHRAHDDPLRLAGLQDITAHVDFTALAEAGHAAGLAVAGYTTQAHFLLGCGLDALLGADDGDVTAARLARASEAKTLVLPGEMGERFQVLAMTRGVAGPWRGFALRDLRARL